MAGGRDNYQTLMDWAADNITEDSIEAFNDAIEIENWEDVSLYLQRIIEIYNYETDY